jgi:hypothetical protein
MRTPFKNRSNQSSGMGGDGGRSGVESATGVGAASGTVGVASIWEASGAACGGGLRSVNPPLIGNKRVQGRLYFRPQAGVAIEQGF